MGCNTIALIVAIVILVLIIVLSWYLYIKASSASAYYWINKWNQQITGLRDQQNAISDVGLPPSMQYASTAQLVVAQKLEALIVAEHDTILAEVLALIAKGYYGYPMSEIDFIQGRAFKEQTGWRPIWVKFLDKWAATSKHLPTLAKIVRMMGTDVSLLHVSVFWPPVELPTHKGISKGVYRYHYGLVIPEGDTGMIVDDVPFKWTERRGVIWDDTLAHSSWNRTDKPRLVIFADLPRRLGYGWDWCNQRILTLIQRTKHIKEIQAKLAKEGITID